MTISNINEKQIFVRAYTKQGFEVFTYPDFVNDLHENDVVFISLGEYENREIESLIINDTKNSNGKIVLMNMNNIKTIDNEDYKKADALIFSNKSMLNSEFATLVEEDNRFVIPVNTTMNRMQSNIISIVNKINIFEDNLIIVNELAKSNNTVHVAFALHDRTGKYCQNIGTVIQSIIDNSDQKCIFHILHDDTLKLENKRKLLYTISNDDCGIDFVYIDTKNISIKSKWIDRYSIGSMFRLFIPETLFNLQKVIYLDADIMFNIDIKELWDIDINNYCVAGVHIKGLDDGFKLPFVVRDNAVELNDYINSGVLLMNLEKIREKGNMLELCCDYLKNHINECVFPDQDAINYVYRNEVLVIDEKFNTATSFERPKTNSIRKVIYHGTGNDFINFANLSDFDKRLLETKSRTSWGYKTIDDTIYSGFSFAYYRIDIIQKLLMKLSRNVKHIFYGFINTQMRNMISIINVSKDDYFICGDDSFNGQVAYDMPIKKLNEISNEKMGEFVVFVSPDASNGKAIKNLESMGLRINVDFFAIPMILTANQGSYYR